MLSLKPFTGALRRFRKPSRLDYLVLAGLWVIAGVITLAVWLLLSSAAFALPLSEGDRVTVLVHEGTEFSGKYQVDLQGDLDLPYLGSVHVAELDAEQAASAIAAALVARGFFQPDFVRVSVQILQWAPIEVAVDGAVFLPGRVRINLPPARERGADASDEIPGGRLPERYLSDALKAAGGVRPDADVRHIQVLRGGKAVSIDVSGFFDAATAADMALMAGDHIIVPSTGQIDATLARPSRITPPGVKVFVSNLTAPAYNNSGSALSSGQVSFAYGSRLSQAVVAANCSGGAKATNAGRTAVLVRTDRLSGETTTWETSIAHLIARPSDQTNPLLLEGDGVFCYDSKVTNLREVFRTIADIVLPLRLILW